MRTCLCSLTERSPDAAGCTRICLNTVALKGVIMLQTLGAQPVTGRHLFPARHLSHRSPRRVLRLCSKVTSCVDSLLEVHRVLLHGHIEVDSQTHRYT
jgi:hypothetical protein